MLKVVYYGQLDGGGFCYRKALSPLLPFPGTHWPWVSQPLVWGGGEQLFDTFLISCTRF